MKDAHVQNMYAETNYETCHVSNQFTHTDYHEKVHNVKLYYKEKVYIFPTHPCLRHKNVFDVDDM